MTPEEPVDDDMFIKANFLATFLLKGRYTKQESRTHMINPVSSTSAASQAVAPQNSAQSKPQPATSAPKDSVHLSPKAQASGDVDHDGDSH
jgi:hypothetical protein